MKQSNMFASFQQQNQSQKKIDSTTPLKAAETSKLLKLSSKLKSSLSDIKIKQFLVDKEFSPLFELEVIVEKYHLDFSHNDEFVMETLTAIFDDAFAMFQRFSNPQKLGLKKRAEFKKENAPCLFEIINKALHVMLYLFISGQNRNDQFEDNLSKIQDYYAAYFGEYAIYQKEPNHYKLQ